LAKSISDERHTEVARKLNRKIVSKADEFVWGSDDSQLAFVAKHLGTLPEREPITEEQRAAALAATLGQLESTAAEANDL
jgi:hypothetical protein